MLRLSNCVCSVTHQKIHPSTFCLFHNSLGHINALLILSAVAISPPSVTFREFWLHQWVPTKALNVHSGWVNRGGRNTQRSAFLITNASLGHFSPFAKCSKQRHDPYLCFCYVYVQSFTAFCCMRLHHFDYNLDLMEPGR